MPDGTRRALALLCVLLTASLAGCGGAQPTTTTATTEDSSLWRASTVLTLVSESNTSHQVVVRLDPKSAKPENRTVSLASGERVAIDREHGEYTVRVAVRGGEAVVRTVSEHQELVVTITDSGDLNTSRITV